MSSARAAPMKGIEDVYPLSPLQQGMLFHSVGAPAAGVYVESRVVELRGPLDPERFTESWRRVIDRHPILRTAFLWQGIDEPLQVVHRRVPVPLTVEDWRMRSEPRAALEERVAEIRRRPFDLTRAPLLRLLLVRLEDRLHALAWCYHHILLDGLSSQIVLRDVLETDRALARSEDPAPAPNRPFRDYIAWLRSQDRSAAEAAWRRELDGLTEPTSLRLPRVAGGSGTEVRELVLPADRRAELERFARRHRVTPATLAQAAWALLLHRYSGRRDLLFGVTVLGRSSGLEGIERMVGLFINTLPARVRVNGDEPVAEWLAEIQRRQAELRRFEAVPLVDIQRWSRLPRGVPLFESILVFENPSMLVERDAVRSALEIVAVTHQGSVTNYPLTVIVEPGEELSLRLMSDAAVVSGALAEALLGHFAALLTGLVDAGGDARVRDLPMSTEAERHRLIHSVNETRRRDGEYAAEASVDRRILERVERWPGAVAVEHGAESLSYRDLALRSAALARRLVRRGVGIEDRVGVLLGRAPETLVALLAIWRAGAAFVPVDPGWPEERTATVLADAGVALALTPEDAGERWRRRGLEVLGLAPGAPAEGNGGAGEDLPRADPDRLAYVLYTSGSTGRPKGVMVSHRALANYLSWCIERYPVAAGRGAPLHSSLAFDLTVTSLFAPLLAGRRVVLVPEGDGVAALIELLRRQSGFSLIKVTPAHLELLARGLDAGALAGRAGALVLGGEALHGEPLRRWRRCAPDTRLVNEYGPTEAVVGCAVHEVTEPEDRLAGPVPIGHPIDNVRLYVLDADLRPAPAEAVGELCIGGEQLARGYLGRPAATALSWRPDPYGEPGGRLYRTGDLGRRRTADGAVEYLGRTDRQVKVQGHRVEPGEVEAALTGHPGVAEAAVELRDLDGEPALVAYLTASAGEVGEESLRNHLRRSLPAPLVPRRFVLLDRMPLTANGKVDRSRLPAPAPRREAAAAGGERPGTGTERTVAAVWCEVLGLDSVGRHDNFFDLGGHSLLLLRAHGLLEERLGRNLDLLQLFDRPTVASLAAALAGGGGAEPAGPGAAPEETRVDRGKDRLLRLRRRAETVA